MHVIEHSNNADVWVQELARAVSTTDAHFRVTGEARRDSYLFLTDHYNSSVVGAKLLG